MESDDPIRDSHSSFFSKIGLVTDTLRTSDADDLPAEVARSEDGLFNSYLRVFLQSLRAKLIVPYVMLTLLTALVGIYVITRLVTSTVRERFVNQLYESSRVAADSTIRRERANLSALRLMVFSEGVAEALVSRDTEALTNLLWPLALNEGVEAVIVLDETGYEVLGLIGIPNSADFEITGRSDFSGLEIVSQVLNGEMDDTGDKFVEVIPTSAGTFIATSAPVRNPAGDLVGVMLIGTRVGTFAAELKAQSLADVVLLDREGSLLGTTLVEPEAGYGILELSGEKAGNLSSPMIREVRLYDRNFQIVFAPWLLRREVHGVLGTVLPSNFIVATEATSRNAFSVIFSAGTVAVIFLGYILAQSIARPILRLRSIAQAVASGDLAQASGLRRSDEIGDLAEAFDIMTARLQERTAEAERLYAEAVDRNIQLGEMYERLQTAQQQLIQSEKLAAVGQLAAGIVHDVKNPLAVIKGMAEELSIDLADPTDVKSGLGVIRDSATRANHILTDLLTFARQSPPAMEMRDLRETVEGSLRLTDYLLRQGKVKVVKQLPETAVFVSHDAQQIEQVLVNLIQNAVQAMPDGGELIVSLDGSADSALISFQDTGVGIATRDLPKIFDPFFTTKPRGEGTGMGLSVSYGIVKSHGGVIEVESKLGEGSVFKIQLPKEHKAEELSTVDAEVAA